MADWIGALKEQADLISRLAAEIPPILNDPNLTPERARRVDELVESGAQRFDALIARMDRDDAVPYAQMRTAEHLIDVWSNLSVLTTNKVCAMDAGADQLACHTHDRLADDWDRGWLPIRPHLN